MNLNQSLISGGNTRDLREGRHLEAIVQVGLHQTCHGFES